MACVWLQKIVQNWKFSKWRGQTIEFSFWGRPTVVSLAYIFVDKWLVKSQWWQAFYDMRLVETWIKLGSQLNDFQTRSVGKAYNNRTNGQLMALVSNEMLLELVEVSEENVLAEGTFFTFTYLLTTEVVGAPRMTSRAVFPGWSWYGGFRGWGNGYFLSILRGIGGPY